MQKTKKTLIVAVMLMILYSLVSIAPAYSQLVLTNQKMKIVKVEREFNRLQCRVHEENKGNVQYILIDGNTKFSTKGKEIHFNKAWKLFKKNMIIRVKGGFTVTGKIKAKTIYW